MKALIRLQSYWKIFPLPGFFRSERELWHKLQKQPHYHLTTLLEQEDNLLPYPINMSPLLSLPHGTLDQKGIPFNAQTGIYPAVYHPTTISQYALAQWNIYLTTNNEACKEAFLLQADWIVAHEQRAGDNVGRWPIPFPAYVYNTPDSWLSALTQGSIISVLVRAYRLTTCESYLQVASRAVRTFELDIHDNGVNTSVGSDGLFFEEVASYPATHILNGYIFALFGLYDYVSLTKDIHIEQLITKSLVTLHTFIDKFDTGYWSRYDLHFRHLATPFYHALHIVLLQALAQYSGCQHCTELAARWATYKYKPTYFIVSRLGAYRRALRRKLTRLLNSQASRTNESFGVPSSQRSHAVDN